MAHDLSFKGLHEGRGQGRQLLLGNGHRVFHQVGEIATVILREGHKGWGIPGMEMRPYLRRPSLDYVSPELLKGRGLAHLPRRQVGRAQAEPFAELLEAR
jgi:hypothetical protein